MSTLKEAIRIEHLMGHKVKASIGMAQGVAKSERQAREACEAQVVDIVEHQQTPRMEVRHGYLIISQVESSTSGWYLIKKLDGLQDGFLYPLCCMSAHGLKAAIDSHLAQYLEDEVVTA